MRSERKSFAGGKKKHVWNSSASPENRNRPKKNRRIWNDVKWFYYVNFILLSKKTL